MIFAVIVKVTDKPTSNEILHKSKGQIDVQRLNHSIMVGVGK